MANKSDRYAMYLRKSRKDLDLEALGEGETLARHRAALTDLAARQGLTVSRVYEEVVSGESIAARPQMQRLLDDVMTGLYAGVLVMEVERLARGNTKDQGEVAEAFAMSGTLIVTPTKTYDPNNEFDEEYFEFGLFMSRREYKTIRRRMERGRVASMEEGNYVGSIAPYGYDVVRVNKKERVLVPNDQAQYVRLMFDWFVNERISPGEIARRLTQMGVPTQTGRAEWHRGTVKDILRNVHYIGMVRWNRRRTTKELDADRQQIRRKRRLTPADYTVHPGKHEPLISREVFDIAQTMFKSAPPLNDDYTLRNPLSGLLFCAECGKAMRYYAYTERANTPPRYAHETQLCNMKSAQAREVQAAVADALRAYIADFQFHLDNDSEKQRAEQHAELIRSMEAAISKLEDKRRQIFDYFEGGIYTLAEFNERKAANEAKINQARAALEQYQSSAPPVVDYEAKIVQFQGVLDGLLDENIPAGAKNKLLKSIIKRIGYRCIDLGRNKGGELHLDVILRE